MAVRSVPHLSMYLHLSIYLLLHWVNHSTAETFNWNNLNLPSEHLPYYFYNNQPLREKCLQDDKCPFKDAANTHAKCWGYEADCPKDNYMVYPECFEKAVSIKAWMNKYQATSQEDVYWKQADFGFVKERRQEMIMYCQPQEPDDSSLECSDYFRYCKANNIYMDFRTHTFTKSDRYSEEIFSPGLIGGHCTLDADKLKTQGEHKSPLQSWFGELQHYTALDFHPIKDKKCDLVVDKPTILMKLDAGVNMYHHFCDYLNLYLSQHNNNSFDTDVQIINWDTSNMNYGDLFSKIWEIFSDHKVQYLREYTGKRVCFKDALFPFLARMRYGLYYNTPLISGCKVTGLFRAFQQHLMHRLGIEQEGPLKNKIRVTLLARGTKYRKMLNQQEIYDALNAVEEYEVTIVNYNMTMPFVDQIKMSGNSDIFMGMHGSGLTHLLFQPDWATIFEIYNCDDVNCYKDLAHLRGLKYYTWDKMEYLVQEDEGHHPTLGAHKKFTNYTFDVEEFKRIVARMADYVKRHPSFRAAKRLKYNKTQSDSEAQSGLEANDDTTTTKEEL